MVLAFTEGQDHGSIPFVPLWLQYQDRRRGPDDPRKLRYEEGTTLSAPPELIAGR